jgi:gliding motility-associated-like protein
VLSSYGVGSLKPKSTFTKKDIFQSAYFLKNVPGLITDYKSQPIRYFADHDGVKVFLTDEGLIYKLSPRDESKSEEPQAQNREHMQKGEKGKKAYSITSGYVTVHWIGANPHPMIEAENKNNGYYTFLAGHADKELHSLVTDGYAKVIYHDLYPGIDVEYSFPEEGGMKYNFIIHPRADVSNIRMQYEGSLNKDERGNIIVHAVTGDLIEHIPISYTSTNRDYVPSSYEVRDSIVTISLPKGYDHSQTLVIDPWVTVLTQLTVHNLGSAVDYDAAGDLYVYGAGSTNSNDLTDYQKVAKYDATGNFLWVFMGSVPAASWNTVGGSPVNYLSNIRVDKTTNKVYVGQAANNAGVQAIRLTSAGVYDNFITVANTNFTEIWSFVSDCSTGSIVILGGSSNTNHSIGIIDTVTGVITSSCITPFGTIAQDIVTGAYDAYGNLYVIMASFLTLGVNNTIYRANTSYNNYVWTAPSVYNSFTEIQNLPAFDVNRSTNNFNGFAANASYLYSYDGYNLEALDLTNGNVVGTPTSIAGYVPLGQGGIVVDYCNHIYLGGQGVIKTFTFDGNTFTAGADIALGTGFSTDAVNDIKYDPSNNLLYVAGSQVVGTYVAPYNDTCTLTNIFTAVVTPICNEAFVQVVPVSGLANPAIAYVWEDSTGTIIRQTLPDTVLTDTLTSINVGKYTVQIQINLNCSGIIITDSFTILCNNLLHTPDTTICAGQSVTLSAMGIPSGGTYSWVPNGTVDSFITVSPTANTTYVVTYTPLSGLPITDSIHVTVNHFTLNDVIDSPFCVGQTSVINLFPDLLFAADSPIIYLDNGQNVSASYNALSGTHYISATNSNGCVVFDTLTIPAITPLLSDTLYTRPVQCNNGNDGAIAITTQGGNPPYSYQWQQLSTIQGSIDTTLSAGVYTIIVTDAKGCADTLSESISGPTRTNLFVSPSDTSVTIGNRIQITSLLSPMPTSTVTYQWTPITGLSCTTCANPTIQSNITQDYILVVKYGPCQLSDTIQVIVQNNHTLYIPNAFTPNGDGINDVFLVFGKEINYFHLQIFDRWGEKVFESDDENQGWDGTYRRAIQPPGVYVYTLDISFFGANSETHKGSISLIR